MSTFSGDGHSYTRYTGALNEIMTVPPWDSFTPHAVISRKSQSPPMVITSYIHREKGVRLRGWPKRCKLVSWPVYPCGNTALKFRGWSCGRNSVPTWRCSHFRVHRTQLPEAGAKRRRRVASVGAALGAQVGEPYHSVGQHDGDGDCPGHNAPFWAPVKCPSALIQRRHTISVNYDWYRSGLANGPFGGTPRVLARPDLLQNAELR